MVFKSTNSPILHFFFIPVTNGEDNSGMLEGLLRGKKGLFPSQCVQEVRLRNPQSVKQSVGITTAPRPVRFDNANLSGNGQQTRHFATAQRAERSM